MKGKRRMRKFKINKKKLIVRIIELIIIIATIILTPMAIEYATAQRGYEAMGGEYLLPILALVIILVIETIYEESEEKKRNEKRRANQRRNKKA